MFLLMMLIHLKLRTENIYTALESWTAFVHHCLQDPSRIWPLLPARNRAAMPGHQAPPWGLGWAKAGSGFWPVSWGWDQGHRGNQSAAQPRAEGMGWNQAGNDSLFKSSSACPHRGSVHPHSSSALPRLSQHPKRQGPGLKVSRINPVPSWEVGTVPQSSEGAFGFIYDSKTCGWWLWYSEASRHSCRTNHSLESLLGEVFPQCSQGTKLIMPNFPLCWY